MALVDYSSSDDSGFESNIQHNENTNTSLKRNHEASSTALPPLPDSFHDLYASTVRTSNQDDPTLHNGRQRQTPHVVGSWPTHVCIEWYPSRRESEHIASILSQLNDDLPSSENHVHSILKSDVGVDLPLHISLSRSLALATDQRQPFTESLEKAVGASGATPFGLTYHTLDWAANYERNRWFLVIRMQRPDGDELNKLLEATNLIASRFDQPTLYTDSNQPSSQAYSQTRTRPNVGKNEKEADRAISNADEPKARREASTDLSSHCHVSIAWTLSQPLEGMKRRTDNFMVGREMGNDLNIDAVKVKVGNAVTSIQLSTKTNSALM